jgi:hypothetical protein
MRGMIIYKLRARLIKLIKKTEQKVYNPLCE